MKYRVTDNLAVFLNLDEIKRDVAYVKTKEAWLEIAEIYKDDKTIRWICQWCHNAYESSFMGRGRRAAWRIPAKDYAEEPEMAAMYACLMLARRLRNEAIYAPL